MASTTELYLQKLQDQLNQTRYRPPDIGQTPANQQIAKQQQLQKGTLVLPSFNNNASLEAQNQEISAQSNILTQTEYEKADQRRKEWERQQQQQFDALGGYQFPTDVSLDGYSDDVLSNAKIIADVGRSMGIDELGIKSGIMAALAESGLKNLNYGDRDSVGLFQQRPSQGWGSVQQIMDPRYAATKFFSAYKSAAQGPNPWNTVQNVQRSAFSNGSNYQAQWAKAQSIYQQIQSGSTLNPAMAGNNPNLMNWINAHNNRYLDYDNAYGAQCVDLYAFYTSGFVGGRPNPVGYAPEIYNNYDSRVYNRLGAGIGARLGDVAVWGKGPYTPLGHVAIVVGDNGNGTLRVLQSNATPAGSAGNSIISNISKAALLGYLRPKMLG